MGFTQKTDKLEQIYEDRLNEYAEEDINKKWNTREKRAAMIRKEFKSEIMSLIKKMNSKYPGFFVDSENNVLYSLSDDLARISMRDKK